MPAGRTDHRRGLSGPLLRLVRFCRAPRLRIGHLLPRVPDVGHRRARMFRVADIRRRQRRTEGGSAD
jgi:hypothetical protein